MTDGLAGTATRVSCHRRLGLLAFVTVAILALVASAAGTGVLAGSGSGSLAPASTAPAAATGGPSFDGYNATNLASAVASAYPAFASYAREAPASVWDKALEDASSGANLRTALGGIPNGESISLQGVPPLNLCSKSLIAQSAGTSCIAGVTTFGLITLVGYFLGSQNVGGVGSGSAFNAARLMAYDLVETLKTQSDAVGTELTALNTTYNAFGYEAAAAALSQLGNATYSAPLDLAESGIAGQLASIDWADGQEIAQALTVTAANFNLIEGASDTLGTSCALSSYPSFVGNGSSAGSFEAPAIGASCPTTTPSHPAYDYGGIYSSLPYTPGGVLKASGAWSASGCPAVYVGGGTGVTAQYSSSNASLVLTFIPVAGGTSINLTLGQPSKQLSNVSFPGGSGAYWVCSPNGSGKGLIAYLSYSFPLNYAGLGGAGALDANQTSPAYFYYLANADSTGSSPNTLIGFGPESTTEPIVTV
jgi:hypothetical protein